MMLKNNGYSSFFFFQLPSTPRQWGISTSFTLVTKENDASQTYPTITTKRACAFRHTTVGLLVTTQILLLQATSRFSS